MPTKREWFGEWFSSPYYHILYKNRNFTEARTFLDNLENYFELKPTDLILDLACGQGRHAICLNQRGYNVFGLDLSTENIAEAKKSENDRLRFFNHDMRELFREDTFDYIFNFFTSFGYFDTRRENEIAIMSAASGLKQKGKLLIDFLNPYTVINDLATTEIKEIEGIRFHLNKSFKDGFLYKDISISDNGNTFNFQEKVKAIRRTEFLEYFNMAGLKLITIFGNYNLEQYTAQESERMIFILEKI